MPDAPRSDPEPPTTNPDASNPVDIAALREELRSLSLWNQHLEAELARRADQTAIWRRRADDRKKRIADLESRVTTRGSSSITSSIRRAMRARTNPADEYLPGPSSVPAARVPEAPPVLESRGPRAGEVFHPSIRVAIVSPTGTAVPRLVGRMDGRVVDGPDAVSELVAADVAVILGRPGVELVEAHPDLREWVANGHPTVVVGGDLRGVPTLGTDDLAYFDLEDDVFVPRPDDPVDDPHTHPTVAAVGRLDRGGWVHAELVRDAPEAPDAQERHLVAGLRRLRSERSGMAVAASLLGAAKVAISPWRQEALAVLLSKRPEMVVEATRTMAAQTYRPLRISVGLHGPAADAERLVRAILEPAGLPHSVTTFPEERAQGSCLDDLARAAPGDIILKIDDDDWYSTVHVEDMVGALAYSGAAVVGKASVFVRLARGGMVFQPGSSYRPVEYVYGPTITASRAAWEAVRFPSRRARVDSVFLRGVRAAGLDVVSHHPWDFCFVRHGDSHTWGASDEYFKAYGRPVDVSWEDLRTDSETAG